MSVPIGTSVATLTGGLGRQTSSLGPEPGSQAAEPSRRTPLFPLAFGGAGREKVVAVAQQTAGARKEGSTARHSCSMG